MHYIFSLSWPYCKRSLFPHCWRKYACSAAKVSVCVCTSETLRERAIHSNILLVYLDLRVLYSGEVWKTNLENGKNNLQSYTCLCPRDSSVPGNIFICMHSSHEAIGGLMKLRWSYLGYISWSSPETVWPTILL